MPVSIILAIPEEQKARALENGFREQTVLVRWEAIASNDHRGRERIESQVLRDIRPYQYLLADYWGAGPD